MEQGLCAGELGARGAASTNWHLPDAFPTHLRLYPSRSPRSRGVTLPAQTLT